MPPPPICDVSQIDQSKIAVSRDEIYAVNPHRYEFQLLDGVFFIDSENMKMAAYLDARADAFWVRGHIPVY